MDFRLDEADIRALAQIEEEVGCDISAGADWGARLGDYLAIRQKPIDQEKLVAVLQEGLGEVLSAEEVEAIANDIQEQVRQQVLVRLQERWSVLWGDRHRGESGARSRSRSELSIWSQAERLMTKPGRSTYYPLLERFKSSVCFPYR